MRRNTYIWSLSLSADLELFSRRGLWDNLHVVFGRGGLLSMNLVSCGEGGGQGGQDPAPLKISNLINSNIKIKFTENIPRKTLLPLRHMRFIIYTSCICTSENKTSAIYLPTWLILIIVYIDSRTKNNIPNAFPFDFGFDEYFPADSEQVIGNGGTCTVETVNTG